MAKDPMTMHLEKLRGNEFEASFLGMMIHHHQSGVEMASLALEKAQNPELKAMAANIKADQEKEVVEMTVWLKDWHSQTAETHPMPAESMKMMQKDMSALKSASGSEFDKLFASQMAKHHLSAIAMAKIAVGKAEHHEVKDAAQKIVKTQTSEHEKLMKFAEM